MKSNNFDKNQPKAKLTLINDEKAKLEQNTTSCENSPFSTNKLDNLKSDLESENAVDFAKTVDPVFDFTFGDKAEKEQMIFSSKEDNLLFEKLFPGVLRENVENDEIFKLFSRFAPKSVPFVSVYSDYLALVDKISADAIRKHTISEQNRLASTGSLSSSSPISSDFYSKEQVLRMSREQIAQNYDKIRKSQEKW